MFHLCPSFLHCHCPNDAVQLYCCTLHDYTHFTLCLWLVDCSAVPHLCYYVTAASAAADDSLLIWCHICRLACFVVVNTVLSDFCSFYKMLITCVYEMRLVLQCCMYFLHCQRVYIVLVHSNFLKRQLASV